jgi:hypothetical protein
MPKEELHIIDKLAQNLVDRTNMASIDEEIDKFKPRELKAHLRYTCGRIEELGIKFRDHGYGDCKENAKYGTEVGSLLTVRISLKKALEEKSFFNKLFSRKKKC